MAFSRHIVIDARIRPDSTGRYADRLLHYLQKIDLTNQYTIILSKDDDWQPSNENFKTINVKYPQFDVNPFNQLAFAWKLYRLKPDMVHFCMTQFPLLYFGNIVVTTHDLTMFDHTHKKDGSAFVHWLKERGYSLLFWLAHRKAKKIIVPTYTVKKDLVEKQWFTLPKIEVTYESGEFDTSTEPEKPEYLSSKDSYIAYVGTAFPHKNLDSLVLAFEKLKAKHKDLKLVFVGKTTYFYEKLKEFSISRGKSTQDIIFTGFVSEAHKAWILKHAKLYVFPTVAEGFGIPPFEAMQNHTPVAASRIPVLEEVLGDAAEYFDPMNPYNIAEVVDNLLGHQSRRSELVGLGQKQLQKYSWEKMAKETYKIYKQTF